MFYVLPKSLLSLSVLESVNINIDFFECEDMFYVLLKSLLSVSVSESVNIEVSQKNLSSGLKVCFG